MNTRINGSLQNPANVQAAACIPGVLLNVSITTPAMKEKKTTCVRELPTGLLFYTNLLRLTEILDNTHVVQRLKIRSQLDL